MAAVKSPQIHTSTPDLWKKNRRTHQSVSLARRCSLRPDIARPIRPYQRLSGLAKSARPFYNTGTFSHSLHGPNRWAGEEAFDAANRQNCATAVSGPRRLEALGKEKPSGEVAVAPDGIKDTLGREFLGVSPHISKLVPLPAIPASARIQ